MHALLDEEIASGTSPSDIFVCGLSQGGKTAELVICIYIRGHKIVTNTVSVFIFAGALAIASVLLYPKTLGGCVVFSGSVPLSKSFADKVSPEARKVTPRSFPYAEHIRTILS